VWFVVRIYTRIPTSHLVISPVIDAGVGCQASLVIHHLCYDSRFADRFLAAMDIPPTA